MHAAAAHDAGARCARPLTTLTTHTVRTATAIHAPAHAKGFVFATESPALLAVPLVILAFLAVVSGYLNAAPFHIEKFHHWMESSIGVELPEAAAFEWVNALPSHRCSSPPGSSSASRCARRCSASAANRLQGPHAAQQGCCDAGHAFLVNKYYLDALYEKVIVRGVAHPIAKAAYWINQNILDGDRQRRRQAAARRPAIWIYKYIDQRSGRRRRQRQRHDRARHRRRAAPGAIRQGQPVRSAAVRCRSSRRARTRHREHLREPLVHGSHPRPELAAQRRHLPADRRRAGDAVHPEARGVDAQADRPRHRAGHARASASTR